METRPRASSLVKKFEQGSAKRPSHAPPKRPLPRYNTDASIPKRPPPPANKPPTPPKKNALRLSSPPLQRLRPVSFTNPPVVPPKPAKPPSRPPPANTRSPITRPQSVPHTWQQSINPKTIDVPELNNKAKRLTTPGLPGATTKSHRPDFVQIVSSKDHNLALDDQGHVWSWGRGRNGVLGGGDTENLLEPKLISSLAGMHFVKIAVSLAHSLALSENGQVFTFGSGTDCQLGHGDQNNKLLPTMVEDLKGFKIVDVSVNEKHTLALTDTGDVYTWGRGLLGRLGHGDEEDILSPKKLDIGSPAKRVFTSDKSSFVTTIDGKLYSFGCGWYGVLGNGQDENATTPQYVRLKAYPILKLRMSQSASSLPSSTPPVAPTVTVTDEVLSGGSSGSDQRRNMPKKSNSVPEMPLNAMDDEDSNSASDASHNSSSTREGGSSRERKKHRHHNHGHHGHHGHHDRSSRAHKKLDEISSDMRTRRNSSRNRREVSKNGRPRYDEAYLRYTIKRLREERDAARRENYKLLKDFEKLNSLLLK